MGCGTGLLPRGPSITGREARATSGRFWPKPPRQAKDLRVRFAFDGAGVGSSLLPTPCSVRGAFNNRSLPL